jgi:beta-xylosidase
MRTSFHPGEIWPDTNGLPINAHSGGILHHEGVYYWYGECRPEGSPSLDVVTGVSCYRSTDLLNWDNLGIALSTVHDDPEHPLTIGCKIERPKVLYNSATGKFVMWWHHDIKGWGHAGAYAGVAVSDTPEGPFCFIEILHPNWRMCRDCTLFQDTDGSAYFVYATDDNSNLCIHRLSEDFLKPTEMAMKVFPGRFMEAPCIFKHEDRYFFIGSDCTGWLPNEARSASAPSIWGPWKELGNPCLGEGAEMTFGTQGTYVLPVANQPGVFVFMADRWNPENLSDSRY